MVDIETSVVTYVRVSARAEGKTWPDAEWLLPSQSTLVDLVTDARSSPPIEFARP